MPVATPIVLKRLPTSRVDDALADFGGEVEQVQMFAAIALVPQCC